MQVKNTSLLKNNSPKIEAKKNSIIIAAKNIIASILLQPHKNVPKNYKKALKL